MTKGDLTRGRLFAYNTSVISVKLAKLFEECLEVSYKRVGNGADYAILRKGDTLYIYFQHSTDCTDWKNNLDFPIKPYKHWYAHRGFVKVWESVADYIAPAVNERSLHNIVSVGYSHGAALALLCHEYVWFHRPDLRERIEGYGFGCPRVIWGYEPKPRFERFYVIRNIGDIVTHLPPRVFGFVHVGNVIEVGEKGKYSPTDAHRPENILKELKALAN